jgi:hypothetical protein
MAFLTRKSVNSRSRVDSPVVVDQPLILISQIQRSGGTLLSQLFDHHPECFAHPYEIKWGRPKKWDWPQVAEMDPKKAFSKLKEGWVEEFASQGLYKKSPQRSYRTYPFVFDTGLQQEIFLRLMRELPSKDNRARLNHYLTSLFNAWLDYQNLYAPNKKFVTGFIPRVVMTETSLQRFFDDYPNGYVISSVRHPAGWYSSAMKHGYEQYGELEEQISFWTRSIAAILQAKERYGDRILVTRFELLLEKPEDFLRRVCEVTGLGWHDALLRPTFNGMPIASNSHYESVDFIDPRAAERYRDLLPARTIADIEAKTGALYAEACRLAADELRRAAQ